MTKEQEEVSVTKSAARVVWFLVDVESCADRCAQLWSDDVAQVERAARGGDDLAGRVSAALTARLDAEQSEDIGEQQAAVRTARALAVVDVIAAGIAEINATEPGRIMDESAERPSKCPHGSTAKDDPCDPCVEGWPEPERPSNTPQCSQCATATPAGDWHAPDLTDPEEAEMAKRHGFVGLCNECGYPVYWPDTEARKLLALALPLLDKLAAKDHGPTDDTGERAALVALMARSCLGHQQPEEVSESAGTTCRKCGRGVVGADGRCQDCRGRA